MSLVKTLQRLVATLDLAGIPYMLSGSVVSSYYGINRSTQDMDLVIDPEEPQLRQFITMVLKSSFYASEKNAVDALYRQTQFNVIDMETAWKADLILRKQRPFSEVEFSRRTQEEILGMSLWITSVEDSILSKLEWASKTRSERQLGDVEGIFRLRGGTLDLPYLKKWAVELGVIDMLSNFLD